MENVNWSSSEGPVISVTFLIPFLAEDKFSYSMVPSLHSLRVCYIKVLNNKKYQCDRESN